MASANETTASPAPAAKVTYADTLLEKAKKLPTGKMNELDQEVRKMREKAAADPETADYFDMLCRSYMSSEASSARLLARFEEWQKQQQQQQQEEEERGKKEEEKKEEERKAREEGMKGKVEKHNSPLDLYTISRKAPRTVPTAAPTAARDDERAAWRAARGFGPYKPGADDWLCQCGSWNNKCWWACRGKARGKEHSACDGVRCPSDIVRVQESGPGTDEHRHHAKYDGDWRCTCGWWNREWFHRCSKCFGTKDECNEYVAVNGDDGELPYAPEKEGYQPTEAQKRSRFFATHKGH